MYHSASLVTSTREVVRPVVMPRQDALISLLRALCAVFRVADRERHPEAWRWIGYFVVTFRASFWKSHQPTPTDIKRNRRNGQKR